MLNVGDRAPKLDLVVSDSEGNQTTLNDLANGGALLLVLLKHLLQVVQDRAAICLNACHETR